MARGLLTSLLSVLFPSRCCLCRNELYDRGLTGVCEDCWASIVPWRGPVCGHCGLPLASDWTDQLLSVPMLCADCRRSEYAFDFARSFSLYNGTLRAAILEFKFRRRERLGKGLGKLLATTWPALGERLRSMPGGDGAPLLVPVPLHASRQRERGFNQAERLARDLARALRGALATGAPQVETRALQRIRATVPQRGLSVQQRGENVRRGFEVLQPERVRGCPVVLIDDVMTTGATLSACAAALKGAGASAVVALTLARATPQFPDVAYPPSLHNDPGSPTSAVDDSNDEQR